MRLLTADVEPLWIARYDYQHDWYLPLHAHFRYFQLISIITGEGKVFLESRHIPLHARQLFFLRPGLHHGLQTNRHSTVRTLDTKFTIYHSPLRQACRQLGPVYQNPDFRINPLLEAMHAEAQQHGPFSNAICQTLLTQILLLLLKSESIDFPVETSPVKAENGNPDLCQRIGGFLRENCEKQISQRLLSESLHYSYRHLHAVWQARYGESPLRTLWRYRVERAMKLIRYSDYELKSIAELTGFATVHHFTRVFTKITKLSPARWRDKERHAIRRDVVIHPGFINRVLTIQNQPGTKASLEPRK